MNLKVNVFVDLQKKILRKKITDIEYVQEVCEKFRLEAHKRDELVSLVKKVNP
jgi:hypothetical protein